MRDECAKMALVKQILTEKYGFDCHAYSDDFISRRVRKRLDAMALTDTDHLSSQLLINEELAVEVMQDFQVSVTRMFRNTKFFLALRKDIIPVLRTYPYLRIWVAGCATGEEVYSLAIILHEEGLLKQSQIYATDISRKALDTAREGVYSNEKIRQYSSAYQKAGGKASLADYYTSSYGSVMMASLLKEKIVFASHNMISDASFNTMQLILCRNTLIYFTAETQQQVIQNFSQSLCNDGFLGLGRSETLMHLPVKKDFTNFKKEVKLYRKGSEEILRAGE